jgi:hypothetical protein
VDVLPAEARVRELLDAYFAPSGGGGGDREQQGDAFLRDFILNKVCPK